MVGIAELLAVLDELVLILELDPPVSPSDHIEVEVDRANGVVRAHGRVRNVDIDVDVAVDVEGGDPRAFRRDEADEASWSSNGEFATTLEATSLAATNPEAVLVVTKSVDLEVPVHTTVPLGVLESHGGFRYRLIGAR